MTMIRRVVMSILFSHYRTVLHNGLCIHSQPIPSATNADVYIARPIGAGSMPKEREQYDDGNWYA
jgi:hypothetical protein